MGDLSFNLIGNRILFGTDQGILYDRPFHYSLYAIPAVVPNHVLAALNTPVMLATTNVGAYQWVKDGTNLLAGATNSTLVIPALDEPSQGQYQVQVVRGGITNVSREVRVEILRSPAMAATWTASETFSLSFTPQAGAGYGLESTATLQPADWQPVTNWVATTTNVIEWSTPAPEPTRFYRLQASPQ